MEAAAPPSPTSPLRVLGTALALLAFAGALLWIGLGLVSAPLDGAAEQRALFGDRPPPFGLVLDSAVRLPTGDALVRFRRAGEEPGLPQDVVFLEYRSPAAARAQLSGTGSMGPEGAEQRLKEWEAEKAFDWSVTLKKGELAFGDWSARYLIERSYAKGGGWHEEARVDLSTPARARVLFAHWPPERPADEKTLRELMLALEMPAANTGD